MPVVPVLLLVALVVELIDRTVRELVVPVLTFCVAYALGTAVAFTANLIAFGRFGLEVLPWRKPNPVHGVGDLVENTGRAFDVLWGLVGSMTVPAGLGALGLVAGIGALVTRSRVRA